MKKKYSKPVIDALPESDVWGLVEAERHALRSFPTPRDVEAARAQLCAIELELLPPMERLAAIEEAAKRIKMHAHRVACMMRPGDSLDKIVPVVDGQDLPRVPLWALVQWKEDSPEVGSRITYTYTVDLIQAEDGPRAWRHLGIQWTMEGLQDAKTVSVMEEVAAHLFEAQIRAFFPLHIELVMRMRPLKPIAVSDPRAGVQMQGKVRLRKGRVRMRTPIQLDVLAPHPVPEDADHG